MLAHQYSHQHIADLVAEDTALCVISFNGNCQPDDNSPGVIHTGLTALNTSPVTEVWRVDKPVTRGQDGHCYWNKTDELLCSAIYIDDLEHIEQATEKAYNELLEHIKRMGYEHPFRFWNYLPDINAGTDDDENYKKFCSGRLLAFQQHNISQDAFPAASALGTQANQAVVYVFASKKTGQHYRNNKQINAFDYPRQYGRSSPSFSRATAMKIHNTSLYLVSGTASIIGHQTIAASDISEQLAVTVANLKHLLSKPLADGKSLNPTASRVYVKHVEDLPVIQAFLQKNMPKHNYLYTKADVCRDDLLVEIECHCEQ